MAGLVNGVMVDIDHVHPLDKCLPISTLQANRGSFSRLSPAVWNLYARDYSDRNRFFSSFRNTETAGSLLAALHTATLQNHVLLSRISTSASSL